MNKYYSAIVVLLFTSFTFFGQSKDLPELEKKFWESGDSKQTISEIPEKWANESAVILYREEYYKFTNSGKKMYNPSSFHQRIKLLDKAAVEEFSEFNYEMDKKRSGGWVTFSQDNTILGIKIIKPDGTETKLDVKAETVEQDNSNKVAIPGLEIGDVLDIFIYEDDFKKSFSGTHIYEPQERVLSTVYPIVYRKLSVEVENDYFLNMESYNGAPEIKEVPTDKKSTRLYTLEVSDIEKSEFPRWFYPLVELPSVKFQITFAHKSKNENNASVFLSEDDAERKQKVTKEEIKEYYADRFDLESRGDVKDVLNYIKDQGITDKREQVVQALYYIRHRSFNRFVELLIARENKISYDALFCDMDYAILNEQNFVNYMAGLAKQLEIDYDIIVATADFNGSIENLLLRYNIAHGLRFNFDDPLYFFNLSPHVQAEYFPSSLEGTNVYKIGVVKNRKLEDITLDVLPISSAKENLNEETMSIDFSEGFSKINVKRNMQFSGHFKTEGLEDRLILGDFLDEEFKHYDTKHFYDCKKRQSKSNIEIQKKMDAFMASFKEKREEKIEETAESHFGVKVDDYTYEVVNSARYSNDPLSISDSFSIKDEFIKKAGPNYLFELGKFIGGQVQIKDEEIERNVGVYLDHAKSYKYNIDLKVPDGYEVAGLDKLNINVSNSTGSFVSTAIIENGIFKYATEKVYAKRKYTVTEWPEMLLWLNAAYDFSQDKIMFKKI